MCAKRSHYNVWTYLNLTGLLQSKYFHKKLLKIAVVSASARWFPQIETDEVKDLKPLITQERLCTLILLSLELKFYKNLDYNEIISVAFEMKARKKVGINIKHCELCISLFYYSFKQHWTINGPCWYICTIIWFYYV